MDAQGPSVSTSRSRRVRVLSAVLVVLAPLAAWRILVHLRESPAEPDPPADIEHFRSDAERLDRLRAASIPAPPEVPATAEWPQWRGPGRDGISGHKVAAESWAPAGPRRLWTVPGGPGHSSLSISGGRALTLIQDGEDEVVVCLDENTGETRWRHRYRAKFFQEHAGSGPHGTPTVADGRVYVVGATGVFNCLDAETGKVVWQRDLIQDLGGEVPMHGVSVSPLVDGERVVVMAGPVAAYDRKEGRPVWKSGSDRSGHSSPIAATIGGRKQLVALTGQTLLGLSPEDGSRLWSFPWETAGNINVATPIIAGSYVFISSGYGKGCALLEISQDAKGGFAARAVYEHNRMRSKFATSVLHREHLYGFDETFLVCMELRTGKVRWKQRGFGQGNVLLAGDRLIVLGEEGRLALVEPSSDVYRELSSCAVSKTRCWAPPSLAHGRLFIRDQESIACFDLEPRR